MLAASILLPALTAHIILFRGAELPGEPYRYWSVEDATLDSSQADDNLGGLAYLNGGPGKTILIRFGDLRRALGPRRRVVSARLELTPTGADSPRLVSATSVVGGWNEGPAFVVRFNAGGAAKTAAPRSATYKHRRTGPEPIAWQGIGCSGLSDAVSIPGASGSQRDGRFVVDGIASAIQQTYDDPFEGGGLALRFEAPCEFFSSQAPEARPRLVVETAPSPEPAGDLSVTLISRSPWPATIDGPAPTSATQDGSSFSVYGAPQAGPWPKDGETITYTATIKNVGAKAFESFSCRWAIRESWGSWADYRRRLEPGESTTVQYTKPFRFSADHRFETIACEIRAAEDGNPANNGLDVPETGIDVSALIGAAPSGVSLRGSAAAEDWAQSVVAQWNRVLLPYSRTSFAPDGARARYFIQSMAEGEEATLPDGTPRQMDTVGYFVPRGGMVRSFEFLLRTTGIAPVRSPGTQAFILRNGSPTAVRLPAPLSPSLFGGGETRYDGGVPGFLAIPPEPHSNPLLDSIVLEPGGLLAATDVYALEGRLNVRSRLPSTHLYDQPAFAVFNAQAMDGRPLKAAKVKVYPISVASDRPSAPIAEFEADAKGSFTLPERKVSPSHPRLKSGPFGWIDALSSSQGYLVDVEYQGQRASTTLYPWQFTDIRARTGPNPVVMELRFNVSDGPIEATNLAKGRLATDSAKSLPATLSALTDEAPGTGSAMPGGAEAWIEIDLGRDRRVGEVVLVVGDEPFWKTFEILGYNTGQLASEAVLWRREREFDWTRRHQAESDAGTSVVRYRAAAKQFRYLRLRTREPIAGAKLREVRVYGAALSP